MSKKSSNESTEHDIQDDVEHSSAHSSETLSGDEALEDEATLASDSSDPVSQLQSEIQLLKQEAQAQKDRALRAIAELDNFRKRKELEVESFKKYAYEKVVTEFLAVLDGFTLAKAQIKPDSDLTNVVEGYQSIEKQFMSVLDKLGVKPIEALNQPFDPNKHQAVMQETVDGVAPDLVVKELQKGFQLHDRVIRPTMVAVSQ